MSLQVNQYDLTRTTQCLTLSRYQNCLSAWNLWPESAFIMCINSAAAYGGGCMHGTTLGDANMQHQQFVRAEIAAPMPGLSATSSPALGHPSTTRQALGCHNKDCLLSPPQHVASSTRLCAAYPLAGWLPAVMVMVMTHLALGLGDKSLSQKNSSRTTRTRESPRAQAFQRNHSHGSHLDLDFSDSTTCREALRSEWMSQLFPFRCSTWGGTCVLSSTALEAGHRHYCALCVLVVWYHFPCLIYQSR